MKFDFLRRFFECKSHEFIAISSGIVQKPLYCFSPQRHSVLTRFYSVLSITHCRECKSKKTILTLRRTRIWFDSEPADSRSPESGGVDGGGIERGPRRMNPWYKNRTLETATSMWRFWQRFWHVSKNNTVKTRQLVFFFFFF